MTAQEIAVYLRVLASSGGAEINSGGCEGEDSDVLRVAATLLEKQDAEIKVVEAARAELQRRLDDAEARVLPGALLWLRREPEGHFTLLLEGTGTSRRALGLVENQSDVPELIQDRGRLIATTVCISEEQGRVKP